MNPRDRDGDVLQYYRLINPSTEQPATGRRTQRRRRNIIIGAVAAAIAVSAAVIVIATTSGSSSRSGLIINGCNIGPDAQCPGADLHGANLAGADLHGANLAGANLAGVDVNSSGIIGTPSALPAGWVLVGGVLRQG